MPFGFRLPGSAAKTKPGQPEAGGTPAAPEGAGGGRGLRTGVPFDGLTEEWRLVGVMELEGRLLDILNRREAIPIRDMRWATLDALADLKPAPGLQKVDPYDLIVVMAGEGSLPPLNEPEKAAIRIHKVAYDVNLDVPPYEVLGTVFLHPGSDPDRLLDRSTELFFAVTHAVVGVRGNPLGETEIETALVNRSYLRRVEPVDRAVVEAAQRRRQGRPPGSG
jgi:hypothetical protein